MADQFAVWRNGIEWRIAAIRHWPHDYAELETPSGGRTVAPVDQLKFREVATDARPWIYDDSAMLVQAIAAAVHDA